jgi:hypothetical protein
MDYLTLSVPASYLIAFLIDGGVLRAKAFESIGVAGFLHSVVAPGMAMGNALFSADFAGNTFVHNGWNMMFVVVGVIALVLRYHLMKPIRGLESWLRKKCQPKQQTQQIPVTFSPPFLVPRTPGARTATTPNQAGRF